MKFKLNNKNGLVLATKNKYCTHDLNIVPKLEDKPFTENGVYPVSEGYAGHGDVMVNVQPNLEPLEVTEFGTYSRSPSEEAYGFSDVHVNLPIEPLEVTKNGTYTCSEGGYAPIVANITTLDDMFCEQQEKTCQQRIPVSDLGFYTTGEMTMSIGSDVMSVTNTINNDILGQTLSSISIIKSPNGPSLSIAGSAVNDYDAYYDHKDGAYNSAPWRFKIVGKYDSNSREYIANGIYLVFTVPGTYYVFVNGEAKIKYVVT